MKKTIKLFLPLITIFTIFSCQKEVDDFGAVVNPPNPTNDSIYLDKIYEVYDAGTGLDTQSVLTVSYDAQKRITGWVSSDNSGLLESSTYFYNSSDTIPFKTLLIDHFNSIPDTTASYFTYDASGRNLSDSSYTYYHTSGNSITSTFSYSYVTGKRYGTGKKVITQTTPVIYNYIDTVALDASGNFLSSARYSDYNSGMMELTSTANFTYDNKVSPFARQNIYKAHQQSPNGETLFYEYLSYNNMLTHIETIVTTGTTTFNDNIGYNFNSNNLPVKATITFGTDTTYLLYTYKPL